MKKLNPAKQKEHDLWFWLTKFRIAKLGLDVGQPFLPFMQAQTEADGRPNLFDFDNAAHQTHEIIMFVYECDMKSIPVSDELRQACLMLIESMPSDDFDAHMATLRSNF